MRKTILTILCTLLLLLITVPVFATAVVSSGECGTSATYELTNDGILTITGTGSVGDLQEFFWTFDTTEVTELTINDGITELAYFLFENFTELKTVNIPCSLEYIFFESVFAGCTKLEQFEVPKEHTVYFSEDNILYNKDKTTIHFVSRTTKGEFEVPDGIVTIARSAIAECNAITKITIPTSVQTMELKAISNCASLEAIEAANGNRNFYSQDGVLFYRPRTSLATTLFCYPSGKTGDYTVPSVNKIGEYAFYAANNLENITISDGVFSIGMYAFCDCENLRTVTMTDSVYNIFTGVFRGCKNLTSIKLSENLTNLDWEVFYDCSSLKNVTLPPHITSIGFECFRNCTSLESINIPDTVTRLYCYAFTNCDSLKEVILPDSLISTGNVIFAECDNLETVFMTDSVAAMGDNIFMNCPKLKNVTLSNQLTKIGKYFFYRCESLENIILPKTITTIGTSAFLGCESLKTIDLPDTLTSIGTYAFNYCTSLESIELPESLASISESGFARCTSLTTIKLPSGITELKQNSFISCTSLNEVILNEGLTSIGENCFRACETLNKINIPTTVTSIKNYAFYRCSNLKQLYIPPTVNEIASDAFLYCYNLTLTVEKGSYAHQYALENKISFELTEKELVKDLFHDIHDYDWFHDSVQYVYDAGIMSGNAGMFDPNGEMTRAMIVTTLYRLAGYPEIHSFIAMNYFVDVEKNNNWYVDAVNWAYENEITTGYEGTRLFGTHDPVTREQIAVFLYRFAEYEFLETTVQGSLDKLENADKVNAYAQQAMQWAVGIGLITGIEVSTDNGTIYDLAPQTTATRAQMATMLMRFIEYYNLK